MIIVMLVIMNSIFNRPPCWYRDNGLFGYNYLYLFTHPWVVPYEAYYRVRWFIQRGYRGYSDADVFDLHSYLSKMLPGALRQLNKCGTPIAMYPENMTMEDIDNSTKEEGEAAHQRWLDAVEAMAKGFEAIYANEDELPFPDTNRAKELKEQRDKGLALFIEYFECLWD